MLVLSRRPGEKIVIGNEVIIEILSVSGEGVRVGISAPKETSVHRYEVFSEIESENRQAGSAAGNADTTALENLAALLREKSK
ncbi:MAG: carbon storage regulator CsrA [Pyrinomonadaceae bacterium]|nr:carbon storage regulator CsrA [Pyrinomonadaceae bacterium]